MKTKTCIDCHKPFETQYILQKRCKECKTKYAQEENKPKTCLWCHKQLLNETVFEKYNPRFCQNEECYIYYDIMAKTILQTMPKEEIDVELAKLRDLGKDYQTKRDMQVD